MSYVIVGLLFLAATTLLMFAAFRAGYSLGWSERHHEMILPRNIVDRTNKMIDNDQTHHRHSGLDPKKPVWH